MTAIALFAIGSPLASEYAETCRRLGVTIAAAIRNGPWPSYAPDGVPLLDAARVRPGDVDAPCIVPLFTPAHRVAACSEAAALGLRFADALLDPTAILASSVRAGRGTFVNAGCIAGACAVLGEHVVVNRGASIGHHVAVSDFVSLGPSAVVAGNVTIGRGAMLGAGAVVLPGRRIGERAVVGAGAVVVDDVPDDATVAGNPARILASHARAGTEPQPVYRNGRES